MVTDNDDGRRARAASFRAATIPPERLSGERQRIAKVMARAGLCSRREAEAWVVAGRVSLNGSVLTSPATDVGREDVILVDGAPLPAAERTRLFLFHKPRGLVTSDHDPEGRATVAAFLREHWPPGPRVVTVGRLDINTEGLLLLTNDGGLARILELPRTGWLRRYRVRAKGETNQGVLDALARGVSIDGVDYAGIEARLDRVQGANCWLTMGLREGKNREIKRVLEHIGLEVNRLIRISFGPFQLRDLAEGAVEEVRARILRDQLGESLMAAAGVDLDTSEDVDIGLVAPQPRKMRLSQGRPERNQARSSSGTNAPRSSGPGTERRGEGRPARRADPSDTRPSRQDAGTPARRERPVAGTRKHVSKLRADAALGRRGGQRKRIDRSETTDRKARVVVVERVTVRTGPSALEPTRSGKRAKPALPIRRAEAQRPPRDTARPDSAGRSQGKGRPSRADARRSPSARAKQIRVARSGGPSARSRGPDRPIEAFDDAKGRDRVRGREAATPKAKPNGMARRDGRRPQPGATRAAKNKPTRGPSARRRGTRAPRPKS